MDAEGYVRIQGRVDDVVNVSGHRLSTIEVESALVEHPLVAEAGAVGVAHPMTGQAVAVFVVPVTPPEVDSPAAWSEFAQRAGGPRAPGAAGTDRSAGPRRRSGRARR